MSGWYFLRFWVSYLKWLQNCKHQLLRKECILLYCILSYQEGGQNTIWRSKWTWSSFVKSRHWHFTRCAGWKWHTLLWCIQVSSFLLSFILENTFLKSKHFIFVSPWSYSHSIALWVSVCRGFIQPDLLKLLMLAWFLLVEIVTGQAKQVIHLYSVAYIFNIRNYANSSKTTTFEIPWWKKF